MHVDSTCDCGDSSGPSGINNDDMYLVYPIGKILQYMNRPYGVCYVNYEKQLVDSSAPLNSTDMFKRGFTLPDPSLVRCNLFALVLAVEFVMQNARRDLWGRVVFVIKHKGAFELVQEPKIRTLISLNKNNWPSHWKKNRKFLERIIKCLASMGAHVTYVEPSRNEDTNLEFYVNCDQDPLSEENKEQARPEDKEEFDRLMRIARQHKQGMADLLEVGGHSYAKKRRDPGKKHTIVPKPLPPKLSPAQVPNSKSHTQTLPSPPSVPSQQATDKEPTHVSCESNALLLAAKKRLGTSVSTPSLPQPAPSTLEQLAKEWHPDHVQDTCLCVAAEDVCQPQESLCLFDIHRENDIMHMINSPIYKDDYYGESH